MAAELRFILKSSACISPVMFPIGKADWQKKRSGRETFGVTIEYEQSRSAYRRQAFNADLVVNYDQDIVSAITQNSAV